MINYNSFAGSKTLAIRELKEMCDFLKKDIWPAFWNEDDAIAALDLVNQKYNTDSGDFVVKHDNSNGTYGPSYWVIFYFRNSQ